MVNNRSKANVLVTSLGWFVLVIGVTACGRMPGDDGPRDLAGAKKRMEARVDAWCTCFKKAQMKKESKAEGGWVGDQRHTTRCMNHLPGAKFETRMAESARLNSAQAIELRSYAISYRRSVEKNCR